MTRSTLSSPTPDSPRPHEEGALEDRALESGPPVKIPVGRRPRGVALHRLSNHLLVTNSGSNTVSVIDGRTRRTLGDPIPVGPSPFGIAVDDQRNLAWVANLGSGRQPSTVSLIRLSDRRVVSLQLSQRPSTHGPVAVAVDSQSGLAFVTHGSEGTIYALDPNGPAVRWTLTADIVDPFGIAYLNGLLFVAQRSHGEVAVIEVEQRRVIQRLRVGDTPLEVAASLAQKRVYITNHRSHSVSLIELPSLEVRTLQVGGEPYGIALDPYFRESLVYVAASDDHTVTALDSEVGTAVSTTRVGRFPHCLALDSRSQDLYVADHLDDTVTVLAANRHHDLYFRDNFEDQGQFPTGGGFSASPDLIPSGTRPVENPQQRFRDSWQQDVGEDLVAGEKNYVYVRGRNLSSTAAEGKVQLHYSKGSLLLWPDRWRHQIVRTETGADHVEIRASGNGEIAVGEAPFHFDPALVEGDHYCFIGRMVTELNPNPVPEVANLHDFVRYVALRPGVVWRNIHHIAANDIPDWTREVQFALADPDEREIHFYLQCINCPVGAEVAFHCGTPGPDPLIRLERTKISRSTRFTAGMHSLVPGHFPGPGQQTAISVTFWRNGQRVPNDARVTLNAAKIFSADHELAPLGVPPESLGLPASLVEDCQSRAVVLGQFEWRIG